MSYYQDPDLQTRKDTAAAAKKALLQKFQAAAVDPKIARRQAERMAINEARMVRRAEREAARLKRETELASSNRRPLGPTDLSLRGMRSLDDGGLRRSSSTLILR